jgi:hypothetical protein
MKRLASLDQDVNKAETLHHLMERFGHRSFILARQLAGQGRRN